MDKTQRFFKTQSFTNLWPKSDKNTAKIFRKNEHIYFKNKKNYCSAIFYLELVHTHNFVSSNAILNIIVPNFIKLIKLFIWGFQP